MRDLKPSSNERPVTDVNLVPTRRKGYLNKLVSNIKPTKAKPNFAPAVVEDIKCDPPMQAPAKIIPGPKLFLIPWPLELIANKIFLLCWLKRPHLVKTNTKIYL